MYSVKIVPELSLRFTKIGTPCIILQWKYCDMEINNTSCRLCAAEKEMVSAMRDFWLERGMGLSPKVPTDAFKKYV